MLNFNIGNSDKDIEKIKRKISIVISIFFIGIISVLAIVLIINIVFHSFNSNSVTTKSSKNTKTKISKKIEYNFKNHNFTNYHHKKITEKEIHKLIIKEKKRGLNITEKTIEIPNVKHEYNFLFISDVHTDVSNVVYHNAWNSYKNQRIDLFTNQKGMKSYEQLKEWIKICNREKFDALLLGGDIIDFGDEANIKFIRKNLKSLQIPYLYARGNHDGFNVMDKKRRQLKNLDGLKKAFLNKDLNCGYVDYGDFIVCHINDALNYVPEVALNEFKKVYKKKKPIILFCHVPLCTENNSNLKKVTKEIRGEERLIGPNLEFKMDGPTKEFYDLVTAKESPVVCVLAGHLHFHHEDWLNKRTVQYVNGCATYGEGYVIRVKGK